RLDLLDLLGTTRLVGDRPVLRRHRLVVDEHRRGEALHVADSARIRLHAAGVDERVGHARGARATFRPRDDLGALLAAERLLLGVDALRGALDAVQVDLGRDLHAYVPRADHPPDQLLRLRRQVSLDLAADPQLAARQPGRRVGGVRAGEQPT